jgi:hypothetical protein
MKSNLSIQDFRDRLESLTNIGEPTINGTPLAIITIFESPNSTFYGQLDKDQFRLTSNGLFNLTPYIMQGTFTATHNGTEVNYKIKPIWFGYLWIRLLPIFAILFFNYFLINEMGTVGLIALIPVNLFLLLFIIIPIVFTNYNKRRLEEAFIKNLEIN